MKRIVAFVVITLVAFVVAMSVLIGMVGAVDFIALQSSSGFNFYSWPEGARVLTVSSAIVFGPLVGLTWRPN